MNESYLNSVRNTVLLSKPSKAIRLLLMVLFVCLFANVTSAATITITANTNWSAITGGSGLGGLPNNTDDIVVRGNAILTVNVNNAICASLQLGGVTGNNSGTLTFSTSAVSNPSLTVTGLVRAGGAGNANRDGIITFINGSTLTAGSLTLGNSGGTPGQGTVTMSAGSIMNVGLLSVINTGHTWNPSTGTVVLTATNTIPNTIFTSFNNLAISAGTTTFGAIKSITNNFSIATGAIANLGTFIHTAGFLTLGGEGTVSGSWGSTTSSATNQNNTYFSATTGRVNNSCTAPTITAQPIALTICENTGGSFSVTSTGGSTYQWQYSADNINWTNIDAALNPYVAGYTTATFTLSNTPAAWSGNYVRCAVWSSGGCRTNSNSVQLTVSPTLSAPTIGTITQPSCSTATGSVVLSGLPTGSWVLTRTPGSVTTTGTGTSTTISGLAAGTTYTYSVNGLSNGLKGEYFNNMTLAGSPVLTRTDATVNFNWSTGSPDALVTSDDFSVRWSGLIQPTNSETYTFSTVSDDGIRLWVNGVQIINQWNDHGPTTHTGTIALAAGVKYSIVLEYYENGGGAVSQLSWSSPTNPTSVIIPTTQLFPVGSCASPASANVVINAQPATPSTPTGTAAQSFCSSNSPTVASLAATGTAIQWYAAASGGSALATTTALVNGTHYYATQTVGGCESTTRFDVTATVSNTVVPTGTAIQTYCSGATVASLIATGTAIKWYAASSGGTTLATTTVLVNGTHYYATQTISGCESTTRFDVTVTINTNPTITPNKVDETCSDSNNGTISPVLSGGLSNVRYIKLIQKYASWQQVAEIQAFEIFTNTNVALASNGATATSSSNYPNNTLNDPNYGPQLAIDNEFTASLNTGFWHSNSTSINEYIQVDLQAGKKINYIRIHNRVNCCWERGQNMLLELYDASNNLVYSKTVNLWEGVNGAHFIDVNVLDVSWADGATTLNRTALDSGTYTLNYSDAVGCSASSPIAIAAINTTPSTPIVGTITQPDCVTATGSVVLTGLPAGNWTINPGGINGNTSSTTISGLAVGTHNFTVSSGSCSSSATANVVINPALTNTWTGVWSQGTPNATQRLVFAGNYPPAVDPDVDITGCSCMVTGGAAVTIKSGKNLIITNEVTVVGSGSLTFQNNTSLVQINNAAINTGNITYHRVTTTQVRNTDYTYWSTPVSPLKLAGVGGIAYGPIALTGSIFYSYLVTSTTEDWKSESASTQMVAGQGYSIRGSGAIATTPIGFLGVSFTGVPNNGNYSIPIAKTNASYLLGNPYPSAIDADAFLTENSAVLDGTLYFWTHNTVIQDRNNITSTAGTGAYAYTSDDYAAYNKTGGTASALSDPSHPGGKIPTGKIAAGQGFFATSTVASGNIVFNNAMRLISNAPIDNTQFFKIKNPKLKTNKIEKNRIWLNLTNDQGAFKQTLVGYITGATNAIDNAFDGESFDGQEFIDFYSVNQDKNLTIQGRALPFDQNDKVPLGFRSTIEGNFAISIDQVDGSMTNQDIYIEDKLTNTVFDLKTGNYTFKTTAGTFDDRFVLKYENASETLNVDQTDKVDGILVLYSNNYKTLIIQNKIEDATVNSVSLFNMLGQSIAVWSIKEWEEQSNIQIPIKNLSSGIYIVKVQTTKGESNKKIIVN